MDGIDRRFPATPALATADASSAIRPKVDPTGNTAIKPQPARADRPIVVEWLLHDIPFIAMLLLALTGVVFRLPVSYWVILMPVFAVISVAEGWRHFSTRTERLGLVYRAALDWLALLLALYLLFDTGVKGVFDANASSLAMMTLLALGTFVAGVQARVWQICAVGGVLFLAVPGLSWLDQSPLLLTAAAVLIIALSGVAWWVSQASRTKVQQ